MRTKYAWPRPRPSRSRIAICAITKVGSGRAFLLYSLDVRVEPPPPDWGCLWTGWYYLSDIATDVAEALATSGGCVAGFYNDVKRRFPTACGSFHFAECNPYRVVEMRDHGGVVQILQNYDHQSVFFGREKAPTAPGFVVMHSDSEKMTRILFVPKWATPPT